MCPALTHNTIFLPSSVKEDQEPFVFVECLVIFAFEKR